MRLGVARNGYAAAHNCDPGRKVVSVACTVRGEQFLRGAYDLASLNKLRVCVVRYIVNKDDTGSVLLRTMCQCSNSSARAESRVAQTHSISQHIR